MYFVDTLSLAYISSPTSVKDQKLASDIDFTLHSLLNNSHLSYQTLADVKSAADADPTLSHLRDLIKTGFPAYKFSLPPDIRKYHSISTDIHKVYGILIHDGTVIILASL